LEVINLYKDLKGTGINVAQEIASLFDEPLNPVNPKAQKKVFQGYFGGSFCKGSST
jgi:hypothetical protein